MDNISTWDKAKEDFRSLADLEWTESKPAGRGKPKAFKSPYMLWCAACDYFSKADATPIIKYDVIKSGPTAGKIIKYPVTRPYSWSGFQAWLWRNKIIRQLDFYRINKDGVYDDYQEVLQAIGDIMFSQKFENAAVGVFKEAIIMRDLQMKEEKSVEEEQSSIRQPVVNVYNTAPPLARSEDSVDTNKSE